MVAVAVCSIAAAMGVAWAVTDGADAGGAGDAGGVGDAAGVAGAVDAGDGPDAVGMPHDIFARAVVLAVELPYAKASVRRTWGWNGGDARNCRGPLRTSCQPPKVPMWL